MTACAGSRASNSFDLNAPPPVISHTEIKRECPAELDKAIPGQPPAPANGHLEGDEASLAWVGAVVTWGKSLKKTLEDAAAQCPKP